MIPNLTIIVTAYVVVRLLTIAVRQFPDFEKTKAARITTSVLSALAVAVVVICAVDTLDTGSKTQAQMPFNLRGQ